MAVKYHGEDGYGPPQYFAPISPFSEEQVRDLLSKQELVQLGQILVHEESGEKVATVQDSIEE